jgi:hypothetical protein
MSDRFTITNTAGSLGDWLSLTPILRAKAAENPLVIAPDAPHTRLFAAVYDGLAEVQFTKDPIPHTPEVTNDVPFSQRILDHYGLSDHSAIPSIDVKPEEVEWARDFLKDYPNPVVLNPTTASARLDKPFADICNYRRLPLALVINIIDHLKTTGHTILKFGTKTIQTNIYNNHEDFPDVVSLPDLSIRQLAACYHVIGNYIGSDSGDHHLCLAVGGECRLFVPPSSWHYDHARTLYIKTATYDPWKGEHVREIYSVYPRPPAKLNPPESSRVVTIPDSPS